MLSRHSTWTRFVTVLCLLAVLFSLSVSVVLASGGGHDLGMPPGKADPAEWRTDLAIYAFVVFLLLMAILTKFAWGPISEALDKREASVADNIANAQKANDDAKAMLAQYEAIKPIIPPITK